MNIIKKHIRLVMKETGLSKSNAIDYILNEGWNSFKQRLLNENTITDWLARAAQQAKEVKEYKQKNKGKELGGVADFNRFEEENKKIRAAKNISSVKKEGMFQNIADTLKKQQNQVFAAKTASLMKKAEEEKRDPSKKSFIDKGIDSVFSFNKKMNDKAEKQAIINNNKKFNKDTSVNFRNKYGTTS